MIGSFTVGRVVAIAAAAGLASAFTACLDSSTAVCADGSSCPSPLVCSGTGQCIEPERIAACAGKLANQGCVAAGAFGYCDTNGICETTCARDCLEVGFDFGAVSCSDDGEDLAACGTLGEATVATFSGFVHAMWADVGHVVVFTNAGPSNFSHHYDGRIVQTFEMPGFVIADAVAGSADDLFASDGLNLYHFNGTEWSEQEPITGVRSLVRMSSGKIWTLHQPADVKQIGVIELDKEVRFVADVPDNATNMKTMGDSVLIQVGLDLWMYDDGNLAPVDGVEPIENFWTSPGEAYAWGSVLGLVHFDGEAWTSQLGEEVFSRLDPRSSLLALAGSPGGLWFGSYWDPLLTSRYGALRADRFVPLPSGPFSPITPFVAAFDATSALVASTRMLKVHAAAWQVPRSIAADLESRSFAAADGGFFVTGAGGGLRPGEWVCGEFGCTCTDDDESPGDCCPAPLMSANCVFPAEEDPRDTCSEGAGLAVFLDADGVAVVVGTTATRLTPVTGEVGNYCGDNAETLVLPPGSRLLAIDGIDSRDALAVGAGGIALRLEGDAWVSTPSPTSDDLIAVTVNDGGAFALSSEGAVFAFDGSAWTAVDVGAIDGRLRSIWSPGPDRFIAVGENGVVLSYDQGTVSPLGLSETSDLVSVTGHGEDEFFVATDDGSLYRFASGRPSRVRGPVNNLDVSQLVATEDGDVHILSAEDLLHTLTRLAPWD